MFNLYRRSLVLFSKQKMKDAFKHFLEHDAGSSVRQEPHQKDRKYINIQIAQEFKRQEQNRKQLRLDHVKARKRLLEQKLTTQSKLLTNKENEELQVINKQISTLQQLLIQQQKDLMVIDAKLEQTEADLVMVQGTKKLVVLNKIQYLKHLNMHPSGLVLHPDILKMIENVHYLVNNNLPVNKFKLFELMPQLFQTEIGELDQSMQKLIEEKKLNPLSDPSGRIRFFGLKSSRFQDPEQDIIDLQKQRDDVFFNMELQIVKILEPHKGYINMVENGLTPFRNTLHMIPVMLSENINLQFTPEQEALRKALHEIIDLKEKFYIYNDEVNKKVIAMRYKYIEPPVFVKNHPVLMERYQKIMKNYMNPKEYKTTLPHYEPNDGGRAYLDQKLREIVIEKYHPKIQKLWNEGRREELVATKKQLQIDFYNDSTRVLQEYNEMLADQSQKQEFLKIAKKPRQIAEQRFANISLDDLTKSVMVNNSNPQKYNIAFFTQFLGLGSEEQTTKLFNSFSYLRVPHQEEKNIEKLDYEILKFKEP